MSWPFLALVLCAISCRLLAHSFPVVGGILQLGVGIVGAGLTWSLLHAHPVDTGGIVILILLPLTAVAGFGLISGPIKIYRALAVAAPRESS